MQNDLDKLQQWEEKWMMSFNPDKCEVLRLTLKRQNIIQATYKIHQQPLKTVQSAKYLGLTIDSKLNYNDVFLCPSIATFKSQLTDITLTQQST